MKPIIAITIGDPAGIGPEIVIKALTDATIYSQCRPLVIGDAVVLQKITPNIRLNCITDPALGKYQLGIIDIIDAKSVGLENYQFGKAQASCGQAAFNYIKIATKLALQKKVAAVATAPINKEALKAANINFIGHTEIFAGLTNTPNPLTLFETKGVRTFFLSRHMSLRDACNYVTEKNVYECIINCYKALQQLHIKEKTLAVAALNPHGGEQGMFGNEEMVAIIPAIKRACMQGCDVVGPISADSIFHLAEQKNYAALLALYHDQGHIGMKSLDFYGTVSLTCGLPFIRTSVDHGTAFDIAGKNIATATSMIKAVLTAVKYS